MTEACAGRPPCGTDIDCMLFVMTLVLLCLLSDHWQFINTRSGRSAVEHGCGAFQAFRANQESDAYKTRPEPEIQSLITHCKHTLFYH